MDVAVWRAQIISTSESADFLKKHFIAGRVRVLPAKLGNGLLLESDDFASLVDAKDVYSHTCKLLQVLTGVLRWHCPWSQAVQSNAVLRVHHDGREELYLYLHDELTVYVKEAVGVASGGTPIDPTMQQPRPQQEIDLALNDSTVAKAYRLLGKSHGNWSDLYRLFELLVGDIGSKEVVDRKWITESEMRLFKHTANSVTEDVGSDDSRHGHSSQQPAQKPMTIESAKSLLHRLFAHWIENKLNIRP